MKTAQHCVALFCLACIASCAEETPELATPLLQVTNDPGGSGGNNDEICHERAGDVGLVATWNAPLQGISIGSTRTLQLHNTSNGQLRVEVAWDSEGLDNRSVSLPQTVVILQADQQQGLDLPLEQLPIRSISHSSRALARLTLTRTDGSQLVLHTKPFHYHFESDYAAVWVYPPAELPNLNGGQVASEAVLTGQVHHQGDWIDIHQLLEQEWQGLDWQTPPPNDPPPTPQGNTIDWPGANNGAIITIVIPDFSACADWGPRYLDTNLGEDIATELGKQHLPAAFAYGQLAKVIDPGNINCLPTDPQSSCVALVWQGHLDEDGCIAFSSEENSQYLLWVTTTFKRDDVTITVNDHGDNGPSQGPVRFRRSFWVPYPNTPLPPFHRAVVDGANIVNAAAAASQMLKQYDLLAGENADFFIRSGKDCTNLPDNACAPNFTTDTAGWIQSNGIPGDLQYKFILSHELGHNLQHLTSGVPATDGYKGGFPASYPLCRCDHVTVANQLHCMQSGEITSAAIVEGWAQFISARFWNDSAQTDCTMGYYKEFLDEDLVSHYPPVPIDCRNPVRWRDNHCFHKDAGTEYDWMQFFWNVTNAGQNTSTIKEMTAVMREGCPNNWCNGIFVTWDMVRQGAEDYHGQNSLKFLKLRDDGDETGVDNDQF